MASIISPPETDGEMDKKCEDICLKEYLTRGLKSLAEKGEIAPLPRDWFEIFAIRLEKILDDLSGKKSRTMIMAPCEEREEQRTYELLEKLGEYAEKNCPSKDDREKYLSDKVRGFMNVAKSIGRGMSILPEQSSSLQDFLDFLE